MVPDIDWIRAVLVFIILHFLIYPASNGYNSYMDRDTGPIGGLEKPPAPSRQLYIITIVLDLAGVALSFLVTPWFGLGMLLYIGASKSYSYRGIRLKKHPFIGYLVVILFQGAATFWLVYHGSVMNHSLIVPWQGMATCSLLIGGFYPLTQVYQHEEDKKDGVTSISYQLGYEGTFIFCGIVYALAFLLLTLWFVKMGQWKILLIIFIFFIPVIIQFTKWFMQVRKNHGAANFRNTMKMVWLAASCSNAAFIILVIRKFFE